MQSHPQGHNSKENKDKMTVYLLLVKGAAETDAKTRGKQTSSGTGTGSLVVPLLLMSQPLPTVFILLLTQQHSMLPEWHSIRVQNKVTIYQRPSSCNRAFYHCNIMLFP